MGMRQRLGLAAALLGDPRVHHPRRAGQRARPRGHPVAARLPAPPRRRGPHPAHLEPHALRGRADRRRRRHHRQRQAGRPGHRGRAARATRRHTCAPPTPSGSGRRCASGVPRVRRPAGLRVTTEELPSSAMSPTRATWRSTSCAASRPTSRSSSSISPSTRATATASAAPAALPPPTGAPVAAEEVADDRRVRAEFRKFFTTRLWWGMAIAVLLVGSRVRRALRVRLHERVAQRPGSGAVPSTDAALAKSVFTGGIQIGYLLTLAIGVMTIGSEYRHQTITATFLAMPRRGRVMAAKVVSLLVIGAFYGVLSLAGAVGAGSPCSPPRVTSRSPTPRSGAPSPSPARPRPLGADRARRRHPHPQPGRGAAHLGRCRLDRRAGARPRPRPDRLGQDIVALPAEPRHPGDARGRQRRLRRPGATSSRGGPAPSCSPRYAAVMAGLGTWRTVRRHRDIAVTGPRGYDVRRRAVPAPGRRPATGRSG